MLSGITKKSLQKNLFLSQTSQKLSTTINVIPSPNFLVRLCKQEVLTWNNCLDRFEIKITKNQCTLLQLKQGIVMRRIYFKWQNLIPTKLCNCWMLSLPLQLRIEQLPTPPIPLTIKEGYFKNAHNYWQNRPTIIVYPYQPDVDTVYLPDFGRVNACVVIQTYDVQHKVDRWEYYSPSLYLYYLELSSVNSNCHRLFLARISG